MARKKLVKKRRGPKKGTTQTKSMGLDIPLYLQVKFKAPGFKLELKESARNKEFISLKDIDYRPAVLPDNNVLHANQEYCPTDEQIREECRKIRLGWTEEMRKEREKFPSLVAEEELLLARTRKPQETHHDSAKNNDNKGRA